MVMNAGSIRREQGKKKMMPGLTGEAEMIVRKEDLVSRLDHGAVEVLSTPRLVQLLEAAAVNAVKNFLMTGQLTLGTSVSIRHLAATPRGMKVKAHALLQRVEKNRLFFLLDAFDEKEKVAEGEHQRFLVDKKQFLERVARKQGRRPPT
jgi:fluoroacetyl-CoA thioesterase